MTFSFYHMIPELFAYSFMAILAVIGILLFLSGYILSGVALYTMAKNKGIDHPWFSWIPFLKMYLLGEIIDDKVAVGEKIIPYAKWILTFGPIVCGLLSQIPYIGWIFSLSMLFYTFTAMYRLYKLYAPQNAVLYLVFSAVFFWIAFLAPLFMLIISKNEPQEYLNAEQEF